MPGEGLEKHNLFGEIDRFKKEREQLEWERNFGEYFDKIVENPEIVRTAHQVAYGAVTSRPDFFTTGRNALFGAEKATERFIDILKAGAQGLEIGRRIIILVGPPGSGKSTLVNGTKRGIEEYTKTEEGAVYAIADCPMQEEPLHLLPKDMRAGIEEAYGIRIEGDLCPHCAATYGGDNVDAETIKNAPVKRVFFSEKDRIGIGTFKPSDPKSQDITELTGSPDYSKIGEYGTASDARAFKFDGELNVANRGVMEFVEMLKSDERFLYTLLDLTQDKVIKAPRFPNISADEVILAHTNMTEYHTYVNNPKNEALRDRMVVIPVPYNLRVSAEQKIHEKLIGQSELVRKSDVHINPRTLEIAATFAVLSRLKDSKKHSKLEKMKIYDGQDLANLSQRDLKELQEEYPDEGMSGISPRFVIDALSTALIEGQSKNDGRGNCLTPLAAIRALKANLDHHPHTRDMKPEDKAILLKDLDEAQVVFNQIAKKEVQSAFVHAYDETAQDLCDNYLNNVEAFCNRTKIIDPITEDELEPDETLMRSIEEKIGISENGKKEFRSELLSRMASIYRSGGTFDHTSHPRLKDAIEEKLFGDMKNMITLTTGSRIPNEEQQKRLNTVQDTLIEEKGYCEHCAPEIVKYVGAMLARG